MKNKVVIIGCGNVGMSYAYALLNQKTRVNELVLIDLDEKRIEYIKTLKDTQAEYVIKVIGAYKRYLRLQQRTQLATVQ